MRIATVLVLVFFLAGESDAADVPNFVQSVDPSGCVLEHVAVEAGTNQYQFDSFSPDRSLIAIGWERGSDERGTYLLDLKTLERQNVPALNNGATFSADGRFLLNSIYVSDSNTDIVLYNIETKVTTVLAPDEAFDWLPSNSPDGSKIVFNSFRTGNSDIYLYDLRSEELEQLTDSANYEAHAQFSPDGESIVYHRQISRTDFNIELLKLSDRSVISLTDNASEESYPSWSPDGQLIAFASDRDQEPGVTDIFVMTKSGNVVTKLTDTPHKDAYPFWSPDGQYLYFMSYRPPQGVYRIPVNDLTICDRGK